MKKKIFFAYESGHPDNIDAIKKGSQEYNRHQKSYSVQTWEDLRVGGSVINSVIFEAINKCDIFACDMTYQNHNVLFELGYAIAKEKRLLILLNDTIAGAKENYNEFKILKNIGYDKFTSSKHINSALQKKIHVETVLLNQLVNTQELEKNTHDIFFINSKFENQASLDLSEYLKSDGLKVISNNTAEVEYQPLIWYITNLFKAKNIILHMIGTDKVDSQKYNAEFSFFAGLGSGLGKNILLIAPEPFNAPIDYTDILVEYSDSDNCLMKTKNWIEQQKNNNKSDIVKEEKTIKEEEDLHLNLLKLGIGYEIAEEEEKHLIDYFIENDSYKKAFNRNSSIVVGRKGSGKSALFIKLISDFDNDKNVFRASFKTPG